MTNLRARLAELDAEIVEQERILYHLKQNRIALQRELNATVFPVATLPFEIVAEIFLHYTPHFHKPYAPVFYPSAPSVAITGVCRAWRDIALATPSLWSTLDVDFDLIPPHVVSVPGLVEGFIYRWLDRAGTCPLSLVFDAPARGHGSGRLMRSQEPFPLSRLRSVIHRYSDQVHSLEVKICYATSARWDSTGQNFLSFGVRRCLVTTIGIPLSVFLEACSETHPGFVI
jgi:hypothetical protein